MKELHNSDWLYKRSAILSTYTPKNVIQRQKVLISYSCCSFQMSEQALILHVFHACSSWNVKHVLTLYVSNESTEIHACAFLLNSSIKYF
jgi:hypothetical protein